jgi:hypothetical protein
MSFPLRWRILVLQASMVIVLAFCAGIAFWASSFTHSYVHDQLAEQQIVFPVASSPALAALPAVNRTAMLQYAGQQLTTGEQARTYANNFIAVHLKEIGKGKPYAYWSGQALAATDPKVKAADDGIAQTLFRGDTLRALLLSGWGWYTMGTYALYAGIGLSFATLVVLAAFLFELLAARKQEEVRVSGPSRSATPIPA